jgi:hypothetical protein
MKHNYVTTYAGNSISHIYICLFFLNFNFCVGLRPDHSEGGIEFTYFGVFLLPKYVKKNSLHFDCTLASSAYCRQSLSKYIHTFQITKIKYMQ